MTVPWRLYWTESEVAPDENSFIVARSEDEVLGIEHVPGYEDGFATVVTVLDNLPEWSEEDVIFFNVDGEPVRFRQLLDDWPNYPDEEFHSTSSALDD